MNMNSKQKIVIVLGPTASGKSSLALELAKKYNSYLISADSRQVYKGMDIGTNKDKGEWRDDKFYIDGNVGADRHQPKEYSVEEKMVDIIEPNEQFTVVDWLKQVKQIIADNPGQLPIIVGGTGLYISALVNNYDLSGSFDQKLRTKLEKLLAKKGIPGVIAKMKKIDPEIENKIDISNARRVVRTAEILLQTKKPLDRGEGESQFEFLQLGVNKPREELYKRIDTRVDQMIDEGLVDEVEGLIANGYDCNSSAMSGIGYRQVCQYLEDQISLSEAIRLVKRDSRRYAKRQLTWFRRDKSIHWVEKSEDAEELVKNFI